MEKPQINLSEMIKILIYKVKRPQSISNSWDLILQETKVLAISPVDVRDKKSGPFQVLEATGAPETPLNIGILLIFRGVLLAPLGESKNFSIFFSCINYLV